VGSDPSEQLSEDEPFPCGARLVCFICESCATHCLTEGGPSDGKNERPGRCRPYLAGGVALTLRLARQLREGPHMCALVGDWDSTFVESWLAFLPTGVGAMLAERLRPRGGAGA
jgi:hypothetical protein